MERENRIMETETVRQLREAVKTAKQSIEDTLIEIDDIKLQQNPAIEADYTLKISTYENRLLQATVAARRARRRATLAQAYVNKAQPVDEDSIEKTLDAEFADWQAKIDQAMDAYLKTMERRSGMKTMNPRDAKRLKELYRKLAKRLHPDLNPGQSRQEERLFAIAQSAYAAGDLQALESLWATIDNPSATPQDAPAAQVEEELLAERALLEAQLSVIRERLAQLKSSFPYKYKDLLADAEWVASTVSHLKAQIEEQQQAQARFDEAYKRLVSGDVA